MAQNLNVAIIGGGYAGMAAAAELAAKRVPLTLFDSSRVLGGRARVVEAHGCRLDNGLHILLGAYRETLRLMRLVGVDTGKLLLRLPLTMSYPGQLHLSAPHLPAPLHLLLGLLSARGLSWREKLAAIRFMQALKRCHFKLAEGGSVTVADLLSAQAQPQRVCDLLWLPLCVAALNTPPQSASAQVFCNVLRDSLAAQREASDMLLPRTDLTSLFPDLAAAYVAARGGEILRNTPIRKISREDDGFVLQGTSHDFGRYSHVITAVAPYHLAALVDALPQLASLLEAVAAIRYQPIITCHFGYPPEVRLPLPMLGHAHGIMQWLFDRGQLCGTPGVLAAVISAQGRHLELPREALLRAIHAEIAGIVPNLPAPLWSHLINEKRATFACTPSVRRPATRTALPGLLLAGDYVSGDYPATLEGAVRSGVATAASILGELPAG
ncbi:MAG: FAD-dependent oxidoreductase [Betaproteobacteria bacterium]|nr:FAD-dependent oxidoreductase [Betaproteobacteria bacterium]